MSDQRTIGLYLDAETVLRNPGYLPRLRDALGLNLVILSFSGVLPPETAALSPFDDVPATPDTLYALLARHIDGAPSTTVLRAAQRSLGPHVSAGGDDDRLRRAIAAAHEAGLDVWLLGGAWTANDFDVLMYCPSHEGVNAWFEAVYTHLATAYDVQGVDVTHARFPMTSYPRGMFLCACARCAGSAREMGYDMETMVADIRATEAWLRRLGAERLARLAASSLGLTDVWQALGARPGLWQWWRFRADLLERNVSRFREAVHDAAGQQFVFGIDTYPASLSLYVGHDHARWHAMSDFASPLLSHVDLFPMQTMAAWTRCLQRLAPGLAERDALRLVYRLVGYDGIGMPDNLADYCLGEPDCETRHIPTAAMLRLDMRKARSYLRPGLPSYPIIQGGGAPHDWPREVIIDLMTASEELGHQGVIFQGTGVLVEHALAR